MPGAAISAAPLASASNPSASAEPASGSCLRHRQPRVGTGSATRTGGGCWPKRHARPSTPSSRPEPRRPRAQPRVRPVSQTKPNKPRKFAYISLDSFGRIGTFQWVTANLNKKTFPALCSLEMPQTGASSAFSRSDASPTPSILSAENVAQGPVFRKKM
jgi:hypothetical protein